MKVWTRRGALRGGVALLAGAVGLEVVGRSREGHAATLPLPNPGATRTATTLTLEARHLRAVPVGGRPGMPLESGARLTLFADLVDATGAAVGRLTGVSHCTASQLSSDDSPVGAVEMHTLTLRDGTIHGRASRFGCEPGNQATREHCPQHNHEPEAGVPGPDRCALAPAANGSSSQSYAAGGDAPASP